MNKLIYILKFLVPHISSDTVIWDYEDDKDYSKILCGINEFKDGGDGCGIATAKVFNWLGIHYIINVYDHVKCPGVTHNGVTKNFKKDAC